MSRAERLLALMQCLRLHHHPVQGAVLATELSISLRTLYRDIATLHSPRAQRLRVRLALGTCCVPAIPCRP
jgi:predicted DNA-binding transcriptional regulator YafY